MTNANSIELITEKLLIKPLTAAQMLAYLRADGTLENELGVKPHPRPISNELKEAIEQTLLPLMAGANADGHFAALWTMIDRTEKRMAGGACFKGSPNERGEVEIGYGVYSSFQNKGYATEAVKAMVQWAFLQRGVSGVLAETEETNLASQRTLAKAGFKQYEQEGPMLWWRMDNPVTSSFARCIEERRTIAMGKPIKKR